MEGLQIASAGSRVKIRLAGQERNLDKESGILVIFAGKQAGDGDHGAIGGIMESSQPVFSVSAVISSTSSSKVVSNHKLDMAAV